MLKKENNEMKKMFQVLIDLALAFGFRYFVTFIGEIIFSRNLDDSQILWVATVIVAILFAEFYPGTSDNE